MPRSARGFVELAPFLVVFAVLVQELLSGEDLVAAWSVYSAGLVVLVPAVGVTLALVRRRPGDILDLWRIPCLLAPLAVLYPWAVVPGHLGMGLAGLNYFLAWWAEDPPNRPETLLGLGCVLGAGAMPVLFAMVVRHGGVRWPVRLGLFLLSLVPWVPAVVALDFELTMVGLGFGGPFLLFAVGPILRFLAVIGMLVGLFWGVAAPRVPEPDRSLPLP